MNTPTEDNRPFVNIDGVQVYAEDLSANGRIYLARLQRLNSKKATAVADIEEIIGSIVHFENLLVADYMGEKEVEEEDTETEVEEVESEDESDS
tara:strand:- start:3306 stop:3587 length:282 start_codon:yes stop_codon:yes gene_type:complete